MITVIITFETDSTVDFHKVTSFTFGFGRFSIISDKETYTYPITVIKELKITVIEKTKSLDLPFD